MLDSQCQFLSSLRLAWLGLVLWPVLVVLVGDCLDDGLSHARSVPVNQDPFWVCFVWLLPGPLGLGGVHTFTESLILAQDERWRRA